MKLLSISIGIVNQEYRPLSQVNFVRKQIQMRHHFITKMRFYDMLGVKRMLIEEHWLWNWNQNFKKKGFHYEYVDQWQTTHLRWLRDCSIAKSTYKQNKNIRVCTYHYVRVILHNASDTSTHKRCHITSFLSEILLCWWMIPGWNYNVPQCFKSVSTWFYK